MEKIVYHGSPFGNIDKLEARVSTHLKKCIYATDNKVIAMLFMARGKGDLDTLISYDEGKIVLVERRENVLNQLYNKTGYMYELDGSTFEHYDYLWTPEVISFEETIKPINKTFYPNILEVLKGEEQKGNIIIYRYPNRPEYVPQDNSDLIDKYIKFYQLGFKDSIDQLLSTYPELNDKVQEKLEQIKKNQPNKVDIKK